MLFRISKTDATAIHSPYYSLLLVRSFSWRIEMTLPKKRSSSKNLRKHKTPCFLFWFCTQEQNWKLWPNVQLTMRSFLYRWERLLEDHWRKRSLGNGRGSTWDCEARIRRDVEQRRVTASEERGMREKRGRGNAPSLLSPARTIHPLFIHIFLFIPLFQSYFCSLGFLNIHPMDEIYSSLVCMCTVGR
jgi:hypothetical protein